ncbi:MAG: patatin-like phospholipase family protein [Candidatus Nanopelagicales bacterium]
MSHPSVRGLRALPRPVAWVFTGGGARAAAQVGMAEVLREQGLAPDLVVGSSTGAINAVGLSGGGAGPESLREAWRLIGTESSLASLGSAAVRAFAPGRTGRSAREFREILARVIAGDPRQSVPADLCVVASDLVGGSPVPQRTGPLIDALTASASLPVVFPPVERDGMLLIDGGLTAGAPLDQALDAGAASIVLLDTGASAVAEQTAAAMRWWQIAGLAYSHQIRGQLGHALVRTGEQVSVLTISTDEGGQLDFTRPDDHFSTGRSATSRALAHGLGSGVTGPGVYGIPAGFETDPRLADLLVE